MHPEADALLDAIWAAPGDDTPRLVYADWLEEHRQANYAAFIRLQCAAAREKRWSPAANRLWEQIGEVWQRVADEFWLSDYSDWSLPGPFYSSSHLDAVHFHRGFLRPEVGVPFRSVACSWSLWWPWFPNSGYQTLAPDGWEVPAAECPRLARIRHLRLEAWEGAQDVWAFLESPHLSALEILDLSSVTLSVSELDTLRFLPGLSGVREVRVQVFDPEEYARQTGDPMPQDTPTVAEVRAILTQRFGRVMLRTSMRRETEPELPPGVPPP